MPDSAESGRLEVVPVTRDVARRFIGEHHRHNLPPQMVRIAVAAGGELVGVATAHNPVARMLDDGKTLEVQRSCTDGTRNANSMLYGAMTRAAKALGFHRLITYTLQEESGASLKAAGWVRDAELGERPSWDTPSRPRVQVDLFGEERRPPGPKVRWVKWLVPVPIDGLATGGVVPKEVAQKIGRTIGQHGCVVQPPAHIDGEAGG